MVAAGPQHSELPSPAALPSQAALVVGRCVVQQGILSHELVL